MNRKTVKGFVLGTVTTVMLMGTVTAFASAPISQQLQVYYNNIKLVVDGKAVEMGKDSSGKPIEPFISNGTTYLPVRTVGEALGKKVDLDVATQTVYLGDRPGVVKYLTEEVEPYKNDIDVVLYKLNSYYKLSMCGKEYDTGYKIGDLSSLYFNLNGEYKELCGELGVADFNYNFKIDFNIYLDGNLYKTITLDPKDMPKKITIPVEGVMQLRLEANGTDDYSGNSVGFADVTIE